MEEATEAGKTPRGFRADLVLPLIVGVTAAVIPIIFDVAPLLKAAVFVIALVAMTLVSRRLRDGA